MKHQILAAAFQEKEKNQRSLSDLENMRQSGSITASDYEKRKAFCHRKITQAVAQISAEKERIKQRILDLKIEINRQKTELANIIGDVDRESSIQVKLNGIQKKINEKIEDKRREISQLERLLESKTLGEVVSSDRYQAQNRNRRVSLKWMLLIVAAVSLFISGVAVYLVAVGLLPLKLTDSEKGKLIISTDNTTVPVSWVEIVSRLEPSIVLLLCENQQGHLSSGSGVIVRHDGYILTCRHVIAGARSIIIVVPQSGKYRGLVVGEDNNVDIAVIKIEADRVLTAAVLGDSDLVRSGQEVITIGYPVFDEFGGEPQPIITHGIISAVCKDNKGVAYLQTGAPLNPGSSGGALVNAKGEIIGIPTPKIVQEGAGGIGFALAINEARLLVEKVSEKLSVR